MRICLSYLFANSEGGDELSKALTDLDRMRLKPGAEPSNVRISPNNILTFDGFFGAKFDIVNPRWLLTAPAEIDSRYVEFLHAPVIDESKTVFHSLDRVLIKAGPFAGHEVVIEKVDRRGVPVVTSPLFGGTSFPIDACYLELLVRRKRPMEQRDKRGTRRRPVAHA